MTEPTDWTSSDESSVYGEYYKLGVDWKNPKYFIDVDGSWGRIKDATSYEQVSNELARIKRVQDNIKRKVGVGDDDSFWLNLEGMVDLIQWNAMVNGKPRLVNAIQLFRKRHGMGDISVGIEDELVGLFEQHETKDEEPKKFYKAMRTIMKYSNFFDNDMTAWARRELRSREVARGGAGGPRSRSRSRSARRGRRDRDLRPQGRPSGLCAKRS